MFYFAFEARMAQSVIFGIAISTLIGLWARTVWRSSGRHSKRRTLRWAGIIATALALQCGNLLGHRGEHRLFFDEDVYANMAANLLAGRGANVTSGPMRTTTTHKWPAGFPTVAALGVAINGVEQGPIDTNGVLSIFTSVLCIASLRRLFRSFWLALAATSTFILHPFVGPWYRSGSAEPLAFLLLLSSWLALAQADESPSEEASGFFAIALLSGALASLVRSEMVVITGLSMVWTWRCHPKKCASLTMAITLSIALLVAFGIHCLSLSGVYWAGRPESSFGLTYVLSNLKSNVSFLSESGCLFLIVPAVATYAILSLRGHLEHRAMRALNRLWILTLVLVMVLQIYSAGAYGLPGGSRFLLPVVFVSAFTLSMALHELTKRKVHFLRVAAFVVPAALSLAALQHSNAKFVQTESPAREHAWISRVVRSIPANSLVISVAPYLWANQGILSSPQLSDGLSLLSKRPVFVHQGLLGINWAPTAYNGVCVEATHTRHGDIKLFQIIQPSTTATRVSRGRRLKTCLSD